MFFICMKFGVAQVNCIGIDNTSFSVFYIVLVNQSSVQNSEQFNVVDAQTLNCRQR